MSAATVTTQSFSQITAETVEPGEVLCERQGTDPEFTVIGTVLWIEPDMLGTERTFVVRKDGKNVPVTCADGAKVWIAD